MRMEGGSAEPRWRTRRGYFIMSVFPGRGKEIEQIFSKEGQADTERTEGHTGPRRRKRTRLLE